MVTVGNDNRGNEVVATVTKLVASANSFKLLQI